MREEHYIRLPAQGNIYSTTRLGNISLLGTGNFGKVYAHKSKEVLEELHLVDLPKGNVDIISLDAIEDPFPILGITFIDTTNTTLEDEVKPAYLHIYSSAPSSAPIPDTEGSSHSIETRDLENSEGLGARSSSMSISTFMHSHSTPTTTDSTHSLIDQEKVKNRHQYISKQLEIIGTRPANVIRLNFTPYHLCHVVAENAQGEKRNLFLLSGSDRRIHTYEPNIDEANDCIAYLEVPTRNYFPELPSKFESRVTRIAIEFAMVSKKRITMCGCEDGTLISYIVADASIPKWKSIMDESIESHSSDTSTTDLNSTSVTSLPTDKDYVSTDKEKSSRVNSSSLSEVRSPRGHLDENITKVVHYYSGLITNICFYTDGPVINAVVSSSASPVYHYSHIIGEKFKKGTPLKFSSKWGCIESVCIADVDFDGQDEILIGTFACTLLVYKYNKDIQNWIIVAHRKFPSVIFSVSFFDFSILVVTGRGLHIMAYSDTSHYLKYGLVISKDTAQECANNYNLEKSMENLKLSALHEHDQLDQ